MVGAREQCHLRSWWGEAAMPFGAAHAAYLSARGERAGVPPSLPARCTSRYSGAFAHARRHLRTRLTCNRHRHRPVQGLGFVICVYLIVLQHSANRNHSVNCRGVRPLGGGESTMTFGADHGDCLSARGGTRGRAFLSAGTEHKAGTLARLHTHAGTSAHTPHAEDIDTVLFKAWGS